MRPLRSSVASAHPHKAEHTPRSAWVTASGGLTPRLRDATARTAVHAATRNSIELNSIVHAFMSPLCTSSGSGAHPQYAEVTARAADTAAAWARAAPICPLLAALEAIPKLCSSERYSHCMTSFSDAVSIDNSSRIRSAPRSSLCIVTSSARHWIAIATISDCVAPICPSARSSGSIAIHSAVPSRRATRANNEAAFDLDAYSCGVVDSAVARKELKTK
mmetsp:Transcript_12493/g.41151  ORF Transcript_12493/g.41151 Transcript_12493/m.41151 type:complete len:219 (+) Transcript_12493:330-986(+)